MSLIPSISLKYGCITMAIIRKIPVPWWHVATPRPHLALNYTGLGDGIKPWFEITCTSRLVALIIHLSQSE